MRFIYASFSREELRSCAAIGAPLDELSGALGGLVQYVASSGEIVWMVHMDSGCAVRPEQLELLAGPAPGWRSRRQGWQRLFLCPCTEGLFGGPLHPLWQVRDIARLTAMMHLGLSWPQDREHAHVDYLMCQWMDAAQRAAQSARQRPELAFYSDWLERLEVEMCWLVGNNRARLAAKWAVSLDGPGVYVAVDVGSPPGRGRRLDREVSAVRYACPVVHRPTGVEQIVVRATERQCRLLPADGFTVLGRARRMPERAWVLFDKVARRCPAAAAYELVAAAVARGGDQLRIVEQLLDAGVPVADVLATAETIAR